MLLHSFSGESNILLRLDFNVAKAGRKMAYMLFT